MQATLKVEDFAVLFLYNFKQDSSLAVHTKFQIGRSLSDPIYLICI